MVPCPLSYIFDILKKITNVLNTKSKAKGDGR